MPKPDTTPFRRECYDESMTDTSKHKHSLSMAFRPTVTSPEHASSVIERALDFRAEASVSTRNRLNSAIKDSVSVAGFRDASKAQRHQLREPVLAEIIMGENGRLAGAVLRTWAESNDALSAIVASHLRGRGMSVEGPDLQVDMFKSTWPMHEWSVESDLVTTEDTSGKFDSNDIALMLCYVAGRVPAEPQVETESPLFQQWLDELSELPPEAPEWDYADEFATSVAGLAFARIAERRTVLIEAVANSVTKTREEFDDELQYLEVDIGSWSADDAVSSGVIEPALEVLTELKSALSEYRPIRPQASSRSDESLRAPERKKWEERILEIAASWDEMMAAHKDQGNDVGPRQPDNATDTDAVEAVLAAIQHRDSAHPELDVLRQNNKTLTTENNRLEQDGDHLRADLSTLKDEIGQLKDELSQSREMQEYWRRSYVSASAGQTRDDEEQPAQVTNVSDALALAERTFPGRLRLALNSKSNRNSPFQKPEEVFDALAWLATEYHRRRSNPGDAPNFDKLIKEACPGWSYKPKQTEVTKEQFTEWYTTTMDGKTYELDAHIGKGTSFDPQQTIRIAFDWDDDLKQVVVGFVGRHQRNRRS